MAGVRALQRRVQRIEKAGKPKLSPIAAWYGGSFDKFVDEAYAQISKGMLSDDFYEIIDALRAWENGGVWADG